MIVPGSSGKVGPTPISAVPDGVHAREQERPTFTFGAWSVSLGDTIIGTHRARRAEVIGTATLLYGDLCVSTLEGVFPLQRVAIHCVQPPLPYVEEEDVEAA